MIRNTLLFVLFTPAIFGQSFEFGIKGGVPFTGAFQSTVSSFGTAFTDSKEYAIGPMVELWLPFGLGVEADALYRPLSYSFEGSQTSGTRVNNSIGSWEFPVLGKYRFSLPLVKPYIEAGPSFRANGGAGAFLAHAGFAFGGGVEVGLLKLHVSPELRFTHWGPDTGVPLFGTLHSGQNQAEFLIGLTF